MRTILSLFFVFYDDNIVRFGNGDVSEIDITETPTVGSL